MDTGAQQDAPDTGTDTRGAGTVDNSSASSKSAGIDKGKAPEVPEVQAKLEQAVPDKLHRSRQKNQHLRLQLQRRLLLPLPRPASLP
jgi:hypothetical protein